MFMYLLMLTVLCVLLALPKSSNADSGTQSSMALRFNNDPNSYISFSPDMSPMTQSFSVCLWIKKLQSGNYPCPFAYIIERSGEIWMSDSGYYNELFGSSSLNNVLTSKFTTPLGSWYFYCSTWSLASRTFRIYYNGELVGTQTTPSGRTLQTGGILTLGNINQGAGHQFGGEMFNFSIFSRELTASEVASLSENGLCTLLPESLEDYRRIKWEEILKLSRSGTVFDIDTSCTVINDLKSQLSTTLGNLVEVQGNFNSSQEELSTARGQIGTLREELNNTKTELEETKIELEETKEDLMNVTQSKCVLQRGNLTKWDVFYSPDYYNKTFTRQLYRQLQSTWDTISSKNFVTCFLY